MGEVVGPTRSPETATTVEAVVRAEWGRALGTIARMTGDVGLAEDAVQDALAAALRTWPERGVPDRPGAWITTVARNRALDVLRREARRSDLEQAALTTLQRSEPLLHPVADDQLLLMFTACHPALAPDTRVALTLRLVCGLTVQEIARVTLRSEAAVGKSIQRAKAKIRDAAIPIRTPPPELLPERLPAVVECTYLVFTEGYAATQGDDLVRTDLCDESIRLARLLTVLLPGEPGNWALLALLLLQDSRRHTRLDGHGRLVLLEHQDRARWDREKIDEAADALARAEAGPAPSALAASHRLQAAIAMEHARAPSWEATDWASIVQRYDELLALTGSPVVALNRAVAVSYADGPDAAWPLVDALADDPTMAGTYRLAMLRADLLRRSGRRNEATEQYQQALALAPTRPEREHVADLVAGLVDHA